MEIQVSTRFAYLLIPAQVYDVVVYKIFVSEHLR